jgi:hypothetical protein
MLLFLILLKSPIEKVAALATLVVLAETLHEGIVYLSVAIVVLF